MKNGIATAIEVIEIFQVMKGKQVMNSHKIVQRGRKMREEFQHSVLGGRHLNDIMRMLAMIINLREDLKITVDYSSEDTGVIHHWCKKI